MNFHKLIEQPEYDFLRTNPCLKGNIMLLTLGGSHAYGTNIESSDIDIRGITCNTKASLLGLQHIGYENNDTEQVVDTTTDTTIYVFRKIIPLLLSCNPNTIELLGCKPEHYIHLSGTGKLLLENAKLFLSKRAAYSFGGYATSQLRRLTNALARDAYSADEKEQHIKATCENVLKSYNLHHSNLPEGSIQLSTIPSNRDGLEKEIAVSVSLADYPLRDWQACLNELHNVIKDYEKLNKRNHKKDAEHLNKHAMHLIRLYLMGCDILEKEQIITYREKDHDLLMSIRNGAYMKEDGTYDKEFFELLNDYENRMKYAIENTALPESPDLVAVNDLVVSINYVALTSI